MKHIHYLFGLAAVLPAAQAFAATYTVTPVLLNGPDAEKKVLVVIGDGYTNADMPEFQAFVKDKLIDGAFTQDQYFRAHQSAFNVYRIDLVSNTSGVTIRRYKEGCGTKTKNDDVADSTCNASSSPPCYNHDTALDFIFTHCWGRCWVEGSPTTGDTLEAILDEAVPKRDYVMRVLNVLTGEGGGCGGGGALTIPGGAGWTTLAHEFGHMVSGLYDEYTANAYKDTSYPDPVNTKNCSTVLNANDVVWSDLLAQNISLPTVYDSMSMDVDATVGMFEGCKTYGKNIYRPVHNCRMKGNTNQFCPVCQGVLNETLAGYPDGASDFQLLANYPGAGCKAAGDAAVSYNSSAHLSNTTASAATVMCPARRIHTDEGWANTFSGVVWAVDRHPTEDVCCRLFARTPNGYTQQGSEVCTSGNSSGDQKLDLDFPKVRMGYTFAYAAIRCSVPATSSGYASSVLTYRIGQQRF